MALFECFLKKEARGQWQWNSCSPINQEDGTEFTEEGNKESKLESLSSLGLTLG